MKLLGIFLLIGVALGGEPISLVLKVENMTCSGCVYTVKRVLHKVKGVQKVKVSLRPPEARVTFDASQTTPAQLVEATTKYGYPSMVFIPVSGSDLPDSLKGVKGITVLEGDVDDGGGGILVDPREVDVLKLLESIEISEIKNNSR